MLIAGDKDVAFHYELPSNDDSELTRIKLAFIDIKAITENPAEIKRQMQECGTLLEKLAVNCSKQLDLPRGGKIETFLRN